MAPPSAALEHDTFDIVGGVKPFTSAAGETNIPESLALICFAAFIVYNIAFLSGIDVPAIINFSTTVHRTILGWTDIICQKGVRAISLTIATFSGNWIKDICRQNKYAYAFRTGPEHMISTPSEHVGRTVLVDTVTGPGAGSLALIRGLPSDVSAPELRHYLESILFVQYHQSIDRAVAQPKSENAPIETSRPGLWIGTCVRPKDTVDTPSMSDINTPTSTTSASSTSAIDFGLDASASGTKSLEVEDLPSLCSPQQQPSSRRTN